MFSPEIYARRRKLLRDQVKSGLILFLGNEESSMNYPANTYRFRQDSSFLYFFGLDSPGLAGVVDADGGKDVLFGNDIGLEDVIWMGHQPSLKEKAFQVGVEETAPLDRLKEALGSALSRKRKVHYLPPYRPEILLKINELLDIPAAEVKKKASEELIKAVVAQRSVKIKEEIDQIEMAHDITHEMHMTAMKMVRPGIYEREIAGRIEGIALSRGGDSAFPVILTINGQILHNHDHGNLLREGNLLVNDSGAESLLHYAADITRTIPVGGKFTRKQREIYEIVLEAQETAIKAIRPGVFFKDVHLLAAKVIATRLKDLGFLRGNMEEALKEGIHALFFPHGLGHMLGLDVHDMENLGENYVGYDDKVQRSTQFGLAYLRMARELRPGFVLTVEPGIYFIPALIDKWKEEKKLADFIDYQKVEEYRNFGGIRIEDDVLVTEEGHRVIGKTIPKSVEDLEEAVSG